MLATKLHFKKVLSEATQIWGVALVCGPSMPFLASGPSVAAWSSFPGSFQGPEPQDSQHWAL